MPLSINLGRVQANDRLASHVARQLLHFLVGPLSLHRRERTACVEQMAAGGDKLCELGERSRNDHRKERRRVPRLDASFMDLHVLYAKLDRRLAQERRFLLIRLHERHVPLRPCECERDSR